MVRLPRSALTVTASLALLAQLAALGHAAFVPHARCAEHGEWIEDLGAPVSLAQSATEPQLDAADAATIEGNDEHEHCLVVACTRAPAHLARAALSLARLEHVSTGALAPTAPRSTGLAILHVAPKASPPAHT